MIEVLKETGGWAEMVTDDEIRAGIHLLAETEGIFTEPAGTTDGGHEEADRAGPDSPQTSRSSAITGNGYKTSEVVADGVSRPVALGRAFKEFETWYGAGRGGTA